MRRQASDFASAEAAEVRGYAVTLRLRADDFDMIGNLLAGLQADWDKLGPEVRAGYQRLRREYETSKDTQELAEDAA
jgi:hypothetical protein